MPFSNHSSLQGGDASFNDATCDGTGFNAPNRISYNLPSSGAQFHEVDTLNGAIVYDYSGTTAYTGSGYYNANETDGGGFPTKLPYTYRSTYDFTVNGVVVSHITYTMTCDENGGAAISILNGTGE